MAPNDPVPDPAAPGRVAADRERELALVERVAADLSEVDRVLARLDDGTYGTCEACGSALDDARLADDPTSRWCPDHQPTTTPAAADS